MVCVLLVSYEVQNLYRAKWFQCIFHHAETAFVSILHALWTDRLQTLALLMNKSVTCSTDDSSLVLSLDMKFVNVTMVQC